MTWTQLAATFLLELAQELNCGTNSFLLDLKPKQNFNNTLCSLDKQVNLFFKVDKD
jgi:hypothetical protein